MARALTMATSFFLSFQLAEIPLRDADYHELHKTGLGVLYAILGHLVVQLGKRMIDRWLGRKGRKKAETGEDEASPIDQQESSE